MKIQINTLNAVGRIFITLLFLITVVSCKKEETEDREYREIAWNYLSKAAQETVITNWREAPVAKLTGKEQPTVSVTFGTSQDALLGPIQVFIAVKSKIVLGIGPRF